MTARSRTFDWRFLAMLAFLLMVGYLVLTGVVAIQQNAEKGRQIDSLIATAREDRADANRQQLVLLERLNTYDARQRALLAWLRKNGIDIPTRFIEVPALRTPSGGSSPAPSSSRPNPPAGPTPTRTAGPGKSGSHAHPRGRTLGRSAAHRPASKETP